MEIRYRTTDLGYEHRDSFYLIGDLGVWLLQACCDGPTFMQLTMWWMQRGGSPDDLEAVLDRMIQRGYIAEMSRE